MDIASRNIETLYIDISHRLLISSFSMNGELIRHTRIERGLTQMQLAEAAGITQPTLSLIESGRAGASFRVAAKLALALEISVDSLILSEAEKEVQS